MKTWYFLDEDCNKDAPRSGSYCERCKKKINDPSKAVFIVMHRGGHYFCLADSDNANAMIGPDCWKAVQKFGTFDNDLNQLT